MNDVPNAPPPDDTATANPPVKPVSDEEATAVAKAMDVDGDLKWDSASHEDVVACINAKAEATRFVLGFRAVTALEGGHLKVHKKKALSAPGAAATTAPADGTASPAPVA